jgi:Fe-S oxidoreductase
MNQEQLRELEALCVQEEAPFCVAACPLHLDVRGFMKCCAAGKWHEARKILDRGLPFPEIISRFCDAPCRPACKRGGPLGGALNIGLLERFCLSQTKSAWKAPKLPARKGKIAILGGGLSAMVAAVELSRKGFSTCLFTARPSLGGRLLDAEPPPLAALEQAAATLVGYGLEIVAGQPLELAVFTEESPAFDAFYLDLEEFAEAAPTCGFGEPVALTLALSRPGWFAGGQAKDRRFPVIQQAEDGRRAAVSIERVLQNASLTAERAKEGGYRSRLYTDISHIQPSGPIIPANPDRYTAEEAQAEAQRCLQCQCLECVKECVFLRQFKEYPKTMARKIFNTETIVQGTRSANKMINSCSLCGQCATICPNRFPLAETCLAMRQEMVRNGHMPPSAHEFALDDMAFSHSDACRLARHQPGKTTSRFLFYPGCQLAGSSPWQTQAVYQFLGEKLTGGVGLMLDCCGAPARWAGQAELFQQSLKRLAAEIRALGAPELICACATCGKLFREFLPETKVTSLWQTLDELPETPLPPLQSSGLSRTFALHDPCAARHQPEMRGAVRSLCAKLGLTLEEHDCSGERADCCGYGGLMSCANPPLAEQAAAVKRRRQGDKSTHIVYCAMCRDSLAAHGPTGHLLEYLFPQNTDDPAARPNPGYSARHENRARLKTRLLRELWREDRPEETTMVLFVSEEIRAQLEARHILEEDVRRVLADAEGKNRYLKNEAGHRLAGLRLRRVTYWVEYQPEGQGFRIHNAYSHRMILPEEQQ